MPDLMTFGAVLALIFGILLLLILGFGKSRAINRNKGAWAVLGIVLLLLGIFGTWNFWSESLSQVQVSGTRVSDASAVTAEGEQVIQYQQIGSSSTITLDAYTGSWGGAETKTEVYPAYTVKDSKGNTLVNDANANTTTSFVGESLTIYSTGASYYFDSLTKKVDNERPTFSIEAMDISETTDLVISAYDDTETTALTADDNSNNTADYAGGARTNGESYTYYIKLKNNVKDEVFRLGAILTGYCGDEVDDFELTAPGWTEVNIPNGDLTSSVLQYDDTNESTSCTWKRAYVPTSGDYIELQEWDFVKYEFTLDTDDTTGPSANGDSYVYAGFADFGCEADQNGDIICDWYRHNDAAQAGGVGLDESLHDTMTGLDVAVTIEPQ